MDALTLFSQLRPLILGLILAYLYSWAGWIESYFVRNPVDSLASAQDYACADPENSVNGVEGPETGCFFSNQRIWQKAVSNCISRGTYQYF